LGRSLLSWSIVCTALMAGAPAVAAAEHWEEVPRFQASSVLPPDLRQGPGWMVGEDVGSDGLNNRYLLRTDAGELPDRRWVVSDQTADRLLRE
jgi:hypothetical protein